MGLTELINKYDIDLIEKGLILNYLKVNHISPASHQFLSEYFMGFELSGEFSNDISSLQHTSLAELAVDMELLIPIKDRETNGAFFTPQFIVDYIIESVNPSENDKIADISCGCAAFLLGILRYYTKKYKKKIVSIINDNLYGVDILEYNVRRSKLLIILFALSQGEIIEYDTIHVACDNSLSRNWDIKFDAIVGNPPYVKFQDMSDETRKFLANRYTTTSFGSFNLYFAFFELGYSILNKNGKLGYISPNNYFTSLSGESLRTFFGSTKAINKIVDFNATKVFDVQTYTAITFLSKHSNSFISYARIKNGQSPSEFLENTKFTDNPYEQLSTKKWRLLCDDERQVIQALETSGTPLGKLVNIAVGIATLKDEVYFIEPFDEDDKYYYCNNKYKNNFKIEKVVTKQHVKISKIKKPEDLINNKHRIIFPYHLDNSTAIPYSENEMKKLFPCCYEYLLSMRVILAQRGKGKHEYTPFFAYGRTQGLNKIGAKIYTPTFSQYPRFTLDKNEDSLFTNGYGLFFHVKEKTNLNNTLFDNDNTSLEYPENAEVLLKILNSGLMHYYVSLTSVAIEGGYPCYQKNFIERFSIPELNETQINQLKGLKEQSEIDSYLCNIYNIKEGAPNLWV